MYFQRFFVQFHFCFASHNEGDDHSSSMWMAVDSYQKHFGILCLGQGWPQKEKSVFRQLFSNFLKVKWSYSHVGLIPDSRSSKFPEGKSSHFFPGIWWCLQGRLFHLQPVGASCPSRVFSSFPQLHRPHALILHCLPWLRANGACMLVQLLVRMFLSFHCADQCRHCAELLRSWGVLSLFRRVCVLQCLQAALCAHGLLNSWPLRRHRQPWRSTAQLFLPLWASAGHAGTRRGCIGTAWGLVKQRGVSVFLTCAVQRCSKTIKMESKGHVLLQGVPKLRWELRFLQAEFNSRSKV